MGNNFPDHLESIDVKEGNPVYCMKENCLINKHTGSLEKAFMASSIPKGINIICSSAFANNTNIMVADIPDGVCEIGNWAFSFCRSLKSVVIPNSVTSIHGEAFIGCVNLTSVTMPKKLKSFIKSAFIYKSSGKKIDERKHIKFIFT